MQMQYSAVKPQPTMNLGSAGVPPATGGRDDRTPFRLCLPALIALGLAGCANFWDDVTAVNAYRWQLLFDRTPPLTVLAESKDGDLRARAIRALKEPLEHGGTQQDQDMMMELLASAARTEPQTVSRLAAVEKLGEFKDPRASKAVIEAFYERNNFSNKDPVVRIAALKSLAKIGDPAAVETLTEALARDPDRDVRLTAADGLGRFQNYQATQALVRVLKEEKDVALRHQATESLQQITGQDLPPKAEAWEAFLQQAPASGYAARNTNPFVKLTSWIQGDN